MRAKFYVLCCLLAFAQPLESSEEGSRHKPPAGDESSPSCPQKLVVSALLPALERLLGAVRIGDAAKIDSTLNPFRFGPRPPHIAVVRARATIGAYSRFILQAGRPGFGPLLTEIQGMLDEDATAMRISVVRNWTTFRPPLKEDFWAEYYQRARAIGDRQWEYLSAFNAKQVWKALGLATFPKSIQGVRLDKRSLSKNYQAYSALYPTAAELVQAVQSKASNPSLSADLRASALKDENIRARRFISQIFYFLHDAYNSDNSADTNYDCEMAWKHFAEALADGGMSVRPAQFWPKHFAEWRSEWPGELQDHWDAKQTWFDYLRAKLENSTDTERRAGLRRFVLNTLRDPSGYRLFSLIYSHTQMLKHPEFEMLAPMPMHSSDYLLYRLCLDRDFYVGLDQEYGDGFSVRLLSHAAQTVPHLLQRLRDVEGRNLLQALVETERFSEAQAVRTAFPK
jgi:hypothetical protein